MGQGSSTAQNQSAGPQPDAITSVSPSAPPLVRPAASPIALNDMAAINAQGGITAYQARFFDEEKTKYQEIEPNRLQPEKVNGALGDQVVNDMSDLLSEYDPYLDTTKGPPMSTKALTSVLQGEASVTDAEKKCRAYQGYGGLLQLINDQAANPFAPVRCGWRYKSPGNMSLVPQVAQGALGRRQGPLNNRASEDSLADGVRWFWDLQEARRQMLRDMSRFYRTPQSVALANSMPGGGAASDITWAWCTTTRRAIPVDKQGKPVLPNVQGFNCPPAQTITDTSKLPQNSNVSPLDRSSSQALDQLQQCIRSSAAGTPLSRDCLLLAVKSAGCTDAGTLYHSISQVSPNDSQYDRYLNNSQAFQLYQSKQGSNGLTRQMFQKDQATWSGAVNSVGTLAKARGSPNTPIRASAQDLCSSAGTFDQYDFCADLTDNSPIQEAGIRCLQKYWNENNGKPAGEAYPNNVMNLHSALGNPRTWGQYKQAVNRLRGELNSADPRKQREALKLFTGAVVRIPPDILYHPDVYKLVQSDKMINYTQCVGTPEVWTIGRTVTVPGDDPQHLNATRYKLCSPFYKEATWIAGGDTRDMRKPQFNEPMRQYVESGKANNYIQCLENPWFESYSRRVKEPGDDAGLNSTRYNLCAPYYKEASWRPGSDNRDMRKPQFNSDVRNLVRSGQANNYSRCVDHPRLNAIAQRVREPGDGGGLHTTRFNLCAPFYTEAAYKGGNDNRDMRKPYYLKDN